MILTPNIILEQYKNKKLDKLNASDMLISLIEHSENEDVREESVEILESVGLKSDLIFQFLENLLISDSNIHIRAASLHALKNLFYQKALAPIQYSIEIEDSFLLSSLIDALAEIDKDACKDAIINKIKRINANGQIVPELENIDVEKMIYEDLKVLIDNYIFAKCTERLYYFRRVPFYIHPKGSF